MAKIETGVDKLVELINQEKRVSIDDAAKKLGVGKVVIQEWADFLEEEKVISIEYKFSNTVLVERKLSEKEIKQKAQEFGSSKDAFIRKVESSIKTLDQQTVGLEKIKDEFEKLKKEIGDQISHVKDEVEELEKYDGLKKNLETDIKKQQELYKGVIDKAHYDIKNTEKSYQEIMDKMGIEQKELTIKEKNLKMLEEKENSLATQEKELKERIKAIYELAQTIQSKVDTEQKAIGLEEDHLKQVEKLAANLEREIMKKKDALKPLVDEAQKNEKRILDIQEDIYEKVRQRSSQIKAQIEESEAVISRFNKFFDRKNEIEALLAQIEREREDLKAELNELTKKAVAFEIVKKSSDVNKHIKDLENEFQKIEKKRNIFKNEISKLVKLIKG
jgi:chromosome segregation ATPase